MTVLSATAAGTALREMTFSVVNMYENIARQIISYLLPQAPVRETILIFPPVALAYDGRLEKGLDGQRTGRLRTGFAI